ncbi:hypothetical protein DFH27DRAFT_570604 [Peziza echinospora]|nr:hypothetical protein DFH27DRAFT_570604 [Peziza echinospora]
MRDIGLAGDIPKAGRRRNLSHVNHRELQQRSVRRHYDKKWQQEHDKTDVRGAFKAKHGEDQDSYLEQLRRHQLTTKLLETDQTTRAKFRFRKRSRRDEELSLSTIARELMEALAWFPNCTFSTLPNRKSGLRITHGLDPDIVVITNTFTYHNRAFLSSKGYEPCDVLVWSWVLSSKDGEQAGRRMKAYQESISSRQGAGGPGLPNSESHSIASSTIPSNPKPFPTFVILHTIRRKPLSRPSISHILSISSQMLSHLGTDQKSKMLFYIRMLRRIREENVMALPYLSLLITTHLNLQPNPSAESVEKLTFAYNKLLTLMAIPPQRLPFQAQPVIEQSQFMLLRKMSEMNILVTREGYRAIISVQLAHAKSPQERERIIGMNKSWPPWQKEKDGWSEKGDNETVTRAGVILKQMKDAGYPHLSWEQAAAILAGEDTDRTPTIPTRTYLPLPPSEARLKAKRADMERKSEGYRSTHQERESVEKDSIIWQARIRATRTVEEAWSVFLDSRNTITNPTPRMYFELFQKLVYGERLQKSTQDGQKRDTIHVPGGVVDPTQDESTLKLLMSLPEKLTPEQRTLVMQNHANQLRLKQIQREAYSLDSALPGEGKEVIPAPFSPSEGGVHVPFPPPTVGSLYQAMRRDGVQPTQTLLTMLVQEAKDIDSAEWLIGEDLVNSFWSVAADASEETGVTEPRDDRTYRIRWKLLMAYLTTLVNCGQVERAVRLLVLSTQREENRNKVRANGLAWNVVLKALVEWNGFAAGSVPTSHSKGIVGSEERKRRKVRLILIWKIYRYMQDLGVVPDGSAFKSMCVAGQKAIFLEKEMAQHGRKGLRPGMEILWDGKRPWERMRRIFRELIGNVRSEREMQEELEGLVDFTGARRKAEEAEKERKARAKREEEEAQRRRQFTPTDAEQFWTSFEELKFIDKKEEDLGGGKPDKEKTLQDTTSVQDAHKFYTTQHAHDQINIEETQTLDESLIHPEFYTPYPPPQQPPFPPHGEPLTPTPPSPPPILYIPNFSTLHSYIRLMGFSGQLREIILTLSWMRTVADISTRSDQNHHTVPASTPLSMTVGVVPEGERRRGRMVVVAAGSFLDGGRWEEVGKGILAGMKEAVDEADDAEVGEEGERSGLWGGWPRKEEVWEYRRKSEWGKWGDELEDGEDEDDDDLDGDGDGE